MPRKRGAGRPKFPKGEALDDVVRVRMRTADRAELESAAKKAGRPFPEWTREILLAAARGNGR